MAWYLRWGMVFPFVLISIALAWWAYDSGLEFAGFKRSQAEQELTRLHEQVTKLSAENIELKNQVTQYERKIQIEQASNKETTEQLKTLSDDNVQLQEDLAFFQNLTATRGAEGELGVHRLTLVKDQIPGEYHLRMLLVQSGQRAKIFKGSYQLIATVRENGQSITYLFPLEDASKARFNLSFRYYQRVEQSFRLSPDAQLENVQVRIFEQGSTEPKVRQNVSPS